MKSSHRIQAENRPAIWFRNVTSLRSQRCANNRHGVAAVEAAIVLPTFLIAIFFSLDLGLLVLRSNALSATARNVSRTLSIQSGNFPDEALLLEPIAMSGSIDQLTGINDQALQLLPTMKTADVDLQVDWHDVGERANGAATIRLEYTHQSIVGSLAPWDETRLSAVSEVLVVN
ncbi:TadE-like protein [Roseimaritima multifibrata]|uniref:TadE-like protein n=1 Tax=Roseimaritima multifibrata TaxID=1930274 RepID=A0A517M8T2_9BACT|nr:TadE/TadG family type IV pilus assembly protein [Roseimaritima multifibrata]QDS91296.1 TadE-like protein [Roseimaritima multifibrata]